MTHKVQVHNKSCPSPEKKDVVVEYKKSRESREELSVEKVNYSFCSKDDILKDLRKDEQSRKPDSPEKNRNKKPVHKPESPEKNRIKKSPTGQSPSLPGNHYPASNSKSRGSELNEKMDGKKSGDKR